MKNVKSFSKVLSAMAVSMLILSACKGGDDKPTSAKPTEKVETSAFPVKVKNDKEAVAGGVLKYGLISDTPFEGILNTVFYEGQPDSEVLQFFDEALLSTDENYVYDQDGAATYELSEDKKVITLKIKDNVKWHDGNPVTAEDLEYAYLVIGSPKYTGVRYDTQMSMIEGMEEYHTGKAKNISGVKVIDPQTISITFKEANPSVLTGLWTYPLPKKYLGDVAIDKLVESKQIRKEPIGFGPFKIKKITPGEAVEFEAFKDYWNGAPKLDGVLLKVVNPTIATASLENGDIDIASVSADQYDKAKSLKNIQLLGRTELSYSYIGFKLGHYDAKNGVNVMDNPKFADKRLRKAMAYALDNKSVGEKLYKGLRFPATSVIPPSFPKYFDKNLKGYEYDPKKAKSLLDEAGYKDVTGDGLREDPNGKEFKINFASMSGGDIAEPLAQFYLQAWKDVGLDVQLLDGRLHEFNSFYEMVEKDDPKIEVFAAAWGTGSDPDPSGIWSKNAPFNYVRWVNDENDQLLKDGISPDSFDENHRQEVYNNWQELVSEEVPLIPTLFRFGLDGVNNRVKGYDITPGQGFQGHLHEITVTSEESEKNK
ncbi:oligopeptide ABC transporter substrate-binding protein [Gottfriedia solisilvae]|uniref:ABC transporter substrate-binding protein n=1 Tax=Gottfriedia solisilvae TaxID=1516104 RepID=A0A8J3AWG1_9BACI|nr:oligopeptide ABC transporter substrate-binding protein [Gottfriedia solisilvae]GGI17493.1 ABC transporter substrate-binding protein [Gottfriedia solisilvae]